MVSEYLEVMKAAAVRSGSILLDRSAMTVSSKTSARDVVTSYDIAVQSALVEQLSHAFPEAGFVTEEATHEDRTGSELVFVIDPVDGTMNFVKDLQHSCISIGCLMGGEPAAAVVYDPYRKELFSAARGQGAFLNERPIAVTEDALADTLVLFGTAPYCLEAAEQGFETVKAVYGKCLDIRRTGSAALDLCYVACGRAGLYFEAQISLWDYAAGALIVTEAGGCVTRLDGTPLTFCPGKSSVLAGTGKTVAQSGILQKC